MASLQNLASRLSRSQFARNVATLASAQGVALVTPILMAPILGRVYTPHDYGMLGAYMGIATIFGMIGNWQYGQAVVVQRTERRALGLIVVSIWASAASALLAAVVVAGISIFSRGHGSLEEVSSWLWIVPVTTVVSGCSGALASLANRRRDYGFLSKVSIGSVIVSSAFAITLGVLGVGAFGLVLAYVSGQLVPLAAYSIRYRAAFGGMREFRITRVLGMARGQFNFPRYSLPATVLIALAQAIPILSLTYLGATELAGHFSRAQSLLTLPIGLVGTALAQVFQEKAVYERIQAGNCWVTYRRLLVGLTIFAPPIFLLLAIVAPKLFVTYLGARWQFTGYVAQLLAPMMCLRMIAGPLWPVLSIFGANKQDFWIALVQLAITAALSFLFFKLDFQNIWQIIAYSIAGSVMSALHISQTFRLVRAEAVEQRSRISRDMESECKMS